jgi:hypothetical protein
MNNSLTPITLRMQTAVHQALAQRAREKGQELADYAADQLARLVRDDLDHDERERLDAELEVKDAAIEYAKTQQNGFAPDITLQVFKRIRENDHLSKRYSRAIGNRPGKDRGNWTKARINRSIGAAIKAALGAASQTMGGDPLKVQVTGEFIRSYTPLEPGPQHANRLGAR